MYRCEDCSDQWIYPDSLDSLFSLFRAWVDDGNCEDEPEGIDPFKKTIDPEKFKICANRWAFKTNIGQQYMMDIRPRYMVGHDDVLVLLQILSALEYIEKESCDEFFC